MVKARVLRLRQMGVLSEGELPPASTWPSGALEFVAPSSDMPRRLVLRAELAAPGHGVLFELVKPELVAVTGTCIRLRGIEAVAFGTGRRAAVMQEWLIDLAGA